MSSLGDILVATDRIWLECAKLDVERERLMREYEENKNLRKKRQDLQDDDKSV